MKTIRVVAAVIKAVKEDGRTMIFATQRGYGEFKGGWEFPGGKIEAGETPQEALKPSAEAAKPKPLTATGDPLAPRTAALALAAVSALAVAGLVVAVRRSRSRR